MLLAAVDAIISGERSLIEMISYVPQKIDVCRTDDTVAVSYLLYVLLYYNVTLVSQRVQSQLTTEQLVKLAASCGKH